MKIDTVKFLFAAVISILLGFVCEIVAPETECRNWISFAVASVSICAGLVPALGLSYADVRRGVSIKIFSWILTLALLAVNVIFALREYRVDIYVVITLLLTVAGWVVIYALCGAKPKDDF